MDILNAIVTLILIFWGIYSWFDINRLERRCNLLEAELSNHIHGKQHFTRYELRDFMSLFFSGKDKDYKISLLENALESHRFQLSELNEKLNKKKKVK